MWKPSIDFLSPSRHHPFSPLPTAIKFFCILQFLSPLSVFSHFNQPFVPNRLPLTRSPATSMLLNRMVSAFSVVLWSVHRVQHGWALTPLPCRASWGSQGTSPPCSSFWLSSAASPDLLIPNWPSLGHWSFPFLHLNSLLSLMALSMNYKYASLLLLQKET